MKTNIILYFSAVVWVIPLYFLLTRVRLKDFYSIKGALVLKYGENFFNIHHVLKPRFLKWYCFTISRPFLQEEARVPEILHSTYWKIFFQVQKIPVITFLTTFLLWFFNGVNILNYGVGLFIGKI